MSLTLSGNSPKITADSTGVITSGTAVTASGTSVDFTGIPSWVKRITVMFSGVSTNGSSVVQAQLGDSGGVETTGYLGNVTNSSVSGYFTNGLTSGIPLASSSPSSAANTLTGGIQFINLNGNSWVVFGVVNSSTYMNGMVSGNKTLSDTLTQIRITTVNGTDTFDAGTINILYE